MPLYCRRVCEAGFPSGEKFVGIGLVADIPDQPVAGGVEYIVQGQGQLDNTETGRQVASGFSDGADDGFTEFPGENFQFGQLEPAQVGGRVDDVQQSEPLLRLSIDNEHNYVVRSMM